MVASVLNVAVSGLLAQERRFASAAERTLRASQALASFEPVAARAGAAVPAAPAPEGELLRGLVEQRLALHAYRANAAVLRSVEQLARETIEIIV